MACQDKTEVALLFTPFYESPSLAPLDRNRLGCYLKASMEQYLLSEVLSEVSFLLRSSYHSYLSPCVGIFIPLAAIAAPCGCTV